MINDIEHATRLVILGVYYGYSEESIVEFLHDIQYVLSDKEWNKNRLDTRGCYGFIMSTNESTLYSKNEMADLININRYCPTPYPSNDYSIDAIKKEIAHAYSLMDTDDSFSNKVNHILDICINTNDYLKQLEK